MATADSSNVSYFDSSSVIEVEEVKQKALYIYEVRKEQGYSPAYLEAREEFRESAVNYLEERGMKEETAHLHASRIETEAAIGDVYEAIDKVDAWSKLLEGDKDKIRGEN